MKKYLLLVAFIFVGCSDPADSSLFQIRNGLRYLPNTDEPYSGSAFSLYANGDKKTETNWEDGKIDGEFIFY